MTEEQKKDWVVPVAVGVGVAGAATGLYLYLKGPKGAQAGGKVKATFGFNYNGAGGTYILQVSFGNKIFDSPFFDHVEGLTFTKQVLLAEAKAYTIDMVMTLPLGTTPNVYDAEALIRTPDMETFKYLVKSVTENALTVIESK